MCNMGGSCNPTFSDTEKAKKGFNEILGTMITAIAGCIFICIGVLVYDTYFYLSVIAISIAIFLPIIYGEKKRRHKKEE